MSDPIDYLSVDCSQINGRAIFSTTQRGEFSYDSKKGHVEMGSANLKYLYEGFMNRRLHFDLTQGMHQQIEKWRSESLDKVFGWLVTSFDRGTSLEKALDGCEFVSRRGPISRVAISPYVWKSLNDKNQKLACVKYKGVTFIREYARPDGEDDKTNWNSFVHKASFAGRKFEQLITMDEPEGDEPDTTAPVDPNPEFNGLFKSNLIVDGRPLNLFYGCEFDALRASDGKFVELKTQLKFIGCGKYFSYKALSWYFQSFLIGIDTLVVGIRDEDFVLTHVEYCPLENLQSFLKKSGIDTNKCLLFLHHFLSVVKTELDKVPEGSILVTERLKNTSQFMFTTIDVADELGQLEYAVISKEFREHNWTY